MTMADLKKSIGVIILAGGKSSRMGEDKGLMNLDGKPMIEHVIATAEKISPLISIVANNPAYQRFGHSVFPDAMTDHGPLSGIFTGLENSPGGDNLVLPCDVPFLGVEPLQYLINAHTDNDITVFRAGGKIHPLIGIYNYRCIAAIEMKLLAHQLKVTGIFEALNVRIVPGDQFDPKNFRNINSQEDL
jgi:molybdenum cofactor guanylyltransferase